MTIYLKDIYDDNFVKVYLPILTVMLIKYYASMKNLKPINDYLKKNYQITVDDVLDSIKLSFNKCNNVCSLSIDNNIIEPKSQEKVIALVKLIEYGNLDVKGLHVVDSTFRYIQSHLKEIYTTYKMKGGK